MGHIQRWLRLAVACRTRMNKGTCSFVVALLASLLAVFVGNGSRRLNIIGECKRETIFQGRSRSFLYQKKSE
jgi:hypothetical protein